MNKRWNVLKAEENAVNHLKECLKIHSVLCSILTQRNIQTFEEAKNYFRPNLSHLHDPWLMKDMRIAVERIVMGIKNNEHILIYGDYDVDGTTAVASFYQFLKQLTNHISFYIPNRYKEGYGVSEAGIEFAHKNKISLIITLDCGIKSTALISKSKSLGIDFIICDHHLPDDILPPAVAILNPKQADCTYPYKELCGCGVGFKLMQAIAETYNLSAESYLQYLDLVASAIAADIVPITGENRVLVFYGLQKVNNNPSPGIRALLELANIKIKPIPLPSSSDEKPEAAKPVICTNNLVFIVAPRINAAGRMDDARKAVLLFVENDYTKALEYAEMLHIDNTSRKLADSNITIEALKMLETDSDLLHRKTTVVYNEHWNKGVVGIVASRLIEKHYRPTVVLTKSGDYVAGSARSVPGFNLYEAIHACRDCLIGYGGHFAAAGLTMDEEKVPLFIDQFENFVSSTIHPDLLTPEIVVDAEIAFKDINKKFYDIIHQMEPFGPENMRPVFIAKNVMDTGYSKVVKENHIKFVLEQNGVVLTGIGFNLKEKESLLKQQLPLDIVFTLDLNTWNQMEVVQLKVLDLKLSNDKSSFN